MPCSSRTPWFRAAERMPRILTINGGSSSIRFALFEIGKTSERLLDGKVDRIGSRDATLKVRRTGQQAGNLNIEADKPESAVGALVDWLKAEAHGAPQGI